MTWVRFWFHSSVTDWYVGSHSTSSVRIFECQLISDFFAVELNHGFAIEFSVRTPIHLQTLNSSMHSIHIMQLPCVNARWNICHKHSLFFLEAKVISDHSKRHLRSVKISQLFTNLGEMALWLTLYGKILFLNIDGSDNQVWTLLLDGCRH